VHGLDAVPVRVEQEGAVVVLAVVLPRPRLAVGAVSGGRADPPELVDERAARRDEADVQAVRRLALRQREVVPLDEVLVRVRLRDPEHRQHRLVEPLRGRAVGRADRHVVEHAASVLA